MGRSARSSFRIVPLPHSAAHQPSIPPASLRPLSRLPSACPIPPIPPFARVHTDHLSLQSPPPHPGRRPIPPQPSSPRWTPNISTSIERGDRCSGQNGSILYAISQSWWFERELRRVYEEVSLWLARGRSRGPLRIGFRCKWAKHRSMAMMIMVAECCRREGITVFCYNAEARICGCPHDSCGSLRRRSYPRNVRKHWDVLAVKAICSALDVWKSFRR